MGDVFRACTGLATREQRVSLLPVPREDRTEKGWITDKQGFRCIKKKWLEVRNLGFNPSSGYFGAIYLYNLAEPLIPSVKRGIITLTLMSGYED